MVDVSSILVPIFRSPCVKIRPNGRQTIDSGIGCVMSAARRSPEAAAQVTTRSLRGAVPKREEETVNAWGVGTP